MNDIPKNTLPKTIAEAIELAAAAQTLSKPERLKQHRLCLQGIIFKEGTEGVARYVAEFPEASHVRIKHNPLAYLPKPRGYNKYLEGLAERWLCSDAGRATTNADDVRALNERLGTSYPPGKHFSDPLSEGRRKAIKLVFSRHGFPFDVKAVKTLSGVKAAARAAAAHMECDRRLNGFGVISGNTLVMAGQPYTITRNGGRECIRVMIGGTRQRVYLDQLEWLADLLDLGGGDPLSTTTVRSIVDVAYPTVPADLPAPHLTTISELACTETCWVDPLEF